MPEFFGKLVDGQEKPVEKPSEDRSPATTASQPPDARDGSTGRKPKES
jgi:hypothetical protein